MKAVYFSLLSVALAIFVTGCSREREISGQIFIVTKGRENVKMGLVGVHVATEAQLKTSGAEILRDYKQARQEHEQSQAQARADLAAVQQIESDLKSLVPSGLTVTEANELSTEIESRRRTLESKANDQSQSELLGKMLVTRLLEKLPSISAKTDADGRFTVKAKGKVWLLAQTARTVGKNEETYLWAAVADPTTTQNQNAMLLSNDTLIEGMEELLSFICTVSGESSTPLAVPTIQTNPDITEWASIALKKIKPAIVAAKILAEAEAKLADEKRLAWTGTAMRRAGFKEDLIKRTLTQGGAVVAWGYGESVPLGLSGVVAVAAGDDHTVALKQDGTVVAWGSDSDDQCKVPIGLRGVVAIAAGTFLTIALKQDGTVVAWGSSGLDLCKVPAGLGGVVAIAATGSDAVALKQGGMVVAWGDDTWGECKVPSGLSDVVAIAAGDDHTVALRQDGTVVAWGRNSDDQCKVPAGLGGVVAIAAAGFHTVALKQDGTVVAWGGGSDDQYKVPGGLNGVVAIAVGGANIVALKLD